LAGEQTRRPTVSSQARTTAALKSFFRFLIEEERLGRDQALPLRTPKRREVAAGAQGEGRRQRAIPIHPALAPLLGHKHVDSTRATRA
jgi:hypothetical protein